jgi:hypothetical protein
MPAPRRAPPCTTCTTSAPDAAQRSHVRPEPAAVERQIAANRGLARLDLGGYFSLTEAVIRQAQADAVHACVPWCAHRRGGRGSADCARHRASAGRFLRDLQHGRAGLWSAWVALAAATADRAPLASRERDGR